MIPIRLSITMSETSTTPNIANASKTNVELKPIPAKIRIPDM